MSRVVFFVERLPLEPGLFSGGEEVVIVGLAPLLDFVGGELVLDPAGGLNLTKVGRQLVFVVVLFPGRHFVRDVLSLIVRLPFERLGLGPVSHVGVHVVHLLRL